MNNIPLFVFSISYNLVVGLIAGISYEIIRLAGRSDNIFINLISKPGMWLQKLTTREPDESMIEVAIASVEAVFDWKAYLKEEFGYEVDESWMDDGGRTETALEEDGVAEAEAGEPILQ